MKPPTNPELVDQGNVIPRWWRPFVAFIHQSLHARLTFEQVLNKLPDLTTHPNLIEAFHENPDEIELSVYAGQVRANYREALKPTDYKPDKELVMSWMGLALEKAPQIVAEYNAFIIALGECPEIFAPYPLVWPEQLKLESTDAWDAVAQNDLFSLCDDITSCGAADELSAPIFHIISDPRRSVEYGFDFGVDHLIWHSFVATTIAEYWHDEDLSRALEQREVKLFLSMEEASHYIGTLTPSGWRLAWS